MKRRSYVAIGVMWLGLTAVNAALLGDPLSALVVGSAALAAGVHFGIALALVEPPSSRPERT